VLIAEDNPINQQLARNFLVQRGHDTRIVSDGLSAVSAAAEEPFDLILMDIQMPGMDGIEATAKIREHEAIRGGRHTPIVALTARVMKEDLQRYADAGMEGCIAKPFARGEFLATVERFAHVEMVLT